MDRRGGRPVPRRDRRVDLLGSAADGSSPPLSRRSCTPSSRTSRRTANKTVPQRLGQIWTSRKATSFGVRDPDRGRARARKNDRATAIAKYREVSNDKGLPQLYRDVGTIRAHCAGIRHAEAGAGYRATGAAGEGRQSLVRKRRRDDGLGLSQAEARRRRPDAVRGRSPPTNRSPRPFARRAVQVAGTLGVDASASLPALQQQD